MMSASSASELNLSVIALCAALVTPVVKHLYTWWHTAMR
jgi:hypothetical protein